MKKDLSPEQREETAEGIEKPVLRKT